MKEPFHLQFFFLVSALVPFVSFFCFCVSAEGSCFTLHAKVRDPCCLFREKLHLELHLMALDDQHDFCTPFNQWGDSGRSKEGGKKRLETGYSMVWLATYYKVRTVGAWTRGVFPACMSLCGCFIGIDLRSVTYCRCCVVGLWRLDLLCWERHFLQATSKQPRSFKPACFVFPSALLLHVEPWSIHHCEVHNIPSVEPHKCVST